MDRGIVEVGGIAMDKGLGARWVMALGWVLALGGAAAAGWGLWYLALALSADNRTNPWREFGIAIGIAATIVGALPCLGGLALARTSRRRRRVPADPRH